MPQTVPKQPDERGGAAGRRQEHHPMLQRRRLGGRGAEQRSRHGFHVGDPQAYRFFVFRILPGLIADLLVAGLEEPRQRAVGVFPGPGDDVREPLGGPEVVQEGGRTPLQPAEPPYLVQDDGPGDEAEKEQRGEHEPGDRPRLHHERQETALVEEPRGGIEFDGGHGLVDRLGSLGVGRDLSRQGGVGKQQRDSNPENSVARSREPGEHVGAAGDRDTPHIVA